jgi:hypothetical protein
MSASTNAAREPGFVTRPVAITRPVSVVMPRRKLTERSSEVYPVPAGSVVCTAHPHTESSRVAKKPPCTEPMGL